MGAGGADSFCFMCSLKGWERSNRNLVVFLASVLCIKMQIGMHKSACLTSYHTDTIADMLGYFQGQQILSGYNSLLRGLQSSIVETPDFALLKSVSGLSDLLESMYDGCLPKGIKTFSRSITSGAAKLLSQSEEIKADLESKRFFT